MNRKLMSSTALVLLAVLVGCDGCVFYRYHSAACKQRGAAYEARLEKLKKDAQQNLTIGTRKEDVIRFFAENGIPLSFIGGEATGTIYTTGCAPSGCGSDDALLGLRVQVDKAGSVISEPVVGAIYANCLWVFWQLLLIVPQQTARGIPPSLVSRHTAPCVVPSTPSRELR